MIEITVPPSPASLRSTRLVVSAALSEQGLEPAHVDEVVAVVNELVSAARECRVADALELSLATRPRITTVRLRCDRKVEFRDRPFLLRERLLQGMTLAFGRRARSDGFVDLWAEVVRPTS